MPVTAVTQRPSLSFWLALLGPILGLVIYINALDNPLVGEGGRLSVQNPQVTESLGAAAIWLAPTPGVDAAGASYRPILLQLLRLEWSAWGNSPSSFHSLNVMLFVGAIIIFLLLTGRFTLHPGARLAAVLTLALHPMATQSLYSIAGQGDLLALLASLAGCWVLLLHRQRRLGLGWSASLMTLLVVLALGASELGLMMPFWLLACAGLTEVGAPQMTQAASRRRNRREKAAMAGNEPAAAIESPGKRLAWIGTPVATVVVAYLILRLSALTGVSSSPVPVNPLTAGSAIFLTYLGRLLWPVHPTLFYPETLARSGALMVAGWVTLIALVALTAMAWRRWRPMGVALVLLLTPLVALAHLLPLSFFMSEGALLLALPGLALVVGLSLGWLMTHVRALEPTSIGEKVCWVVLGLVWLALGLQATLWGRGRQWESAEALWQAEAALHPADPRPLIELLDIYVHQVNVDRARTVSARVHKLARPADLDRIQELDVAMAVLQKDDGHLGKLLRADLASTRPSAQGHFAKLALFAAQRSLKPQAESLWRRELKNYPNSFDAAYELADIELQRINYPAAIKMAQEAVRLATPELRAKALARYGVALAEAGHIDLATEELRIAQQLDQTLYLPYVYLARILTGRGDYASAEVVIKACMSNVNVESYVDMADLYTRVLELQKRQEDALNWLDGVTSQYPADVRLGLFAARYQIQFGRYDKARDIYRRLDSLQDEDLSDAYTGMGLIAMGVKNRTQAEQYWRRAIQANPRNDEAKDYLKQLMSPGKTVKPVPAGKPVPPATAVPGKGLALAPMVTPAATPLAPASATPKPTPNPQPTATPAIVTPTPKPTLTPTPQPTATPTGH